MAETRRVYSTQCGRLCGQCGKAIANCICSSVGAILGDGRVRISRETKGRKGKGVTLITGLALPENELKSLAKRLKQRCGTGGTVKQGVIEIQGEHRDTLLEELLGLGYQAKISGG